jgi:hypothetical protein
MTEENISEFAKSLLVTATIYDKELSKDLISVYFDVLKEFDIKDIKNSFTQHIKTGKFFPKPCEIIELVSPKKRYF